ncbi:flagellar filament capping protein FliD [Malikia spinosa]|uniref:Flagellar hook-associated protein 2 n=1 Tax=Malikia spinosa TaxID=86180 RepID=A0A7C9J953_9BURK|nr:flagellar filament capping protein FliD [Malikia spinosa]MYZ52890.1 flagellar filament capping protein FliD [Malikia spinosa]
MGLSSAGIGSGLDVTGIVSQLMSIEQRPLTALTTKQSDYKAKLSAFGSIQSGIASFQSTLKKLSDPKNLQTIKATVADTNVLGTSGGAGAVPGDYSIEVTKLAQSQKLASAGQLNAQAVVGTGTLTFDFGTISGGTLGTDGKYSGSAFTSNGAGSKQVTIDSSNNTLNGIRDAINSASIGVTASVINDGGATPYRLALSNSQTGEASSMKISVSGDAALGNLLNHDPAGSQALTQTVAAQNAALKVDGLDISKPSNTFSDVVPGVTLTLKKTNAGSPTNLSVTRDTNAVKANVQEFVDGYNKLTGSLKSLTSYDMTSKKGAALYGDSSVRNMLGQLRGLVTGTITGGASSLTRLSDAGVSYQADGTLKLDATKLQTVIDTQFDQLPGLFAASGTSTDSQVSYVGSTAKTQSGSYAVSISQLATQGSQTGSGAANLDYSGGNNALQVSLDGLSANINLRDGSYASTSELVSDLQTRINGNSTFTQAGSAVSISADASGVLSMLSNRFGSNSSITLGGTAASLLLGGAGNTTTGLALTGQINGAAATSLGQTLTGASGNAAEGLKVSVSNGSTGSRGNVQYSQGFAYQLDQLASSFLGENGMISMRTDGINSALKRLDSDRLNLEAKLGRIQKQYQDQFTKLDTTMSSMNSTSSYLTGQLTALANNTTN